LDDSFRRERQFTTDASHELRTPLTAMQAILTVMREKRRTPEEYEQALDDLSDEAFRLRALVDDLLRLARSAGPVARVHENINLSTLLHDVADSLRPLAEAKGLTLACEVPDRLALTGDSDELIRLFVNLVDNAIKYTEQGSVSLAASHRDNHHLTVRITDTGPGIAPEHLPHLFDRFYRVEQARATPGAGLGLSIAQSIARAHDGTIQVNSVVNQGTQFVVSFPLPAEEG
jgi:signal transduction histidine kinase